MIHKLIHMNYIPCFIVVALTNFFCFFTLFDDAYGAVLHGMVYNNETGRPVKSGTVHVLEANVTADVGEDGTYYISLQQNGTYTFIVESPGLRTFSKLIDISTTVAQHFYLDNSDMDLPTVTVVGRHQDKPEISQHSMSAENLKAVPASFGDAVSALSTLPGVNRTEGFFGPLVIRGQPYELNNYYIDDIPVFSPLHFGGFHSIISNNFINQIDLYSSAAPAKYDSVSSAVISIRTIDNIKEFGGYCDTGVLSTGGLIQMPLQKKNEYNIQEDETGSEKEEEADEPAGYIIASARYGYLSLLVPYFYKVLTGDELKMVPEYWDYQFKLRYDFNGSNIVKILAFGNNDYYVFNEDGQIDPENGDDPLLEDSNLKTDTYSHSQGIYYVYKPHNNLTNTLMGYAALMNGYTYLNLPGEAVAEEWKDISITSRPYIFGIKDRLYLEAPEKNLKITLGPEYTLYYFTAYGKTVIPTTLNEWFDVGDSDQYETYNLDEKVINHKTGGYADFEWSVKKITLCLGYRTEYMNRSGEITTDPRESLYIRLPADTTFSLAVGKYSTFFQTNPGFFIDAPHIVRAGETFKSAKAIHRVAGLEHKSGLYTFMLEGFYNNFYDLAVFYPHLDKNREWQIGLSSGKLITYGIEAMIRKDLREGQNGFFGWINYTYAHSRYKSGLPAEDGYAGIEENTAGDEWGDQWINSEFDQEHTLKIVQGYKKKRHTISTRFQLYTSTPYTPITGAVYDENYHAITGYDRYVPVQGKPNSERFAINHRLDVRYSYKVNYSWGSLSWYVEIMNIYNYRPKNMLKWNYGESYSKNNPSIIENESELGIVPNFGVEVKF